MSLRKKAIRIIFTISCWLIAGTTNFAIADIRVTDDFNREIVLDNPATRIISLAPHITENLFSAGAGKFLVGVVEHSDYPPDATQISSVGSYVQFNIEKILSLDPDLVVAWRTGNNRSTLQQIEELGIQIYYSEPRTFQDIIENVKDLATLAGTEDFIDAQMDQLELTVEKARNKYSNREPVNVFYQVWPRPLMTLNGDHFVSRVLDLCGARNLFSDLPIIAPRVNIEAVIHANPDIIISGMVDSIEPDMSMWQKWQIVNAVKNNHYIFVDSDVMHRHTLRMLLNIPGFCEKIDHVRQKLIH